RFTRFVASFGLDLMSLRNFLSAFFRTSFSSGLRTPYYSVVSTRKLWRSGFLPLPALTTSPADVARLVKAATGSNLPSVLVCQETVSFRYRAGVARLAGRARPESR